MSLEISKNDKLKLLQKKKLYIPRDKLLHYINFIYNKFILFSQNIEININKNTIIKYANDHINPLLWQIGHVVFFYITLVLKNLLNNQEFDSLFGKYTDKFKFYDSFETPLELRNTEQLIKYNEIIILYTEIIELIIDYVNYNVLNSINTYLILLGVLHNEMHLEALLFTKINLNISINYPDIIYNDDKLLKKIEFIEYLGNYYYQGTNELINKLTFDNEMPEFRVAIPNFKISKHCITEYQYTRFILANGYNMDQYWCPKGLLWKKNNNIKLPLYWHIDSLGNIYKIIKNIKYSTLTNLPMCNISWYEAQAYCKYMGYKLPTESILEYCSTNGGITKYPWGNNEPNINICNIGYKKNIVSVLDKKSGANIKGMSHLIGNVWEWCEEPIYPYNQFTIDPIYREMSYPFFGFKKICKGGCFAVSDILVHPKYRNAQYPDCRIQFIGFRVCL